MRAETIALLRCPSGCGEPLHLQSGAREAGGRIAQGTLKCPTCQRHYSIVDEIAYLLPDSLADNEEDSPAINEEEIARKRSEMMARDAQVDAYDQMRNLHLFGKIEIPVTLAQMNLRANDVLLEAGCGTGRMTPTFATRCRSLIAIDFSGESLRACQRKLRAAGLTNVDLIQADACALPLAEALFDRVVSCQVLEHIPTPGSRSRMVCELARVAKTDATVVVSAYQHSLFTRWFGEKEGTHDGGIYFYRFDRRELRALLAEALDVESITGALVYHYLVRCRKAKDRGQERPRLKGLQPGVLPDA